MSTQITTLTFFRFSSLADKFWGFKMVRNSKQFLAGIPGLEFFKSLGSGKGIGFHPLPDWSVYALLQIWTDEASAQEFFSSSPLVREYDRRVQERGVFFLKNIRVGGEWSGSNPFRMHSNLDPNNSHVAVITRATIKTRYLIPFWRYVPTAQQPIKEASGLLYTKGIGEMPIKQMATFSLWQDQASMRQFAYESNAHQKAIQLTRELNWYSEELFARFQPYHFQGKWEQQSWSF
jgi:heme-degrading monooxygenase HmoA